MVKSTPRVRTGQFHAHVSLSTWLRMARRGQKPRMVFVQYRLSQPDIASGYPIPLTHGKCGRMEETARHVNPGVGVDIVYTCSGCGVKVEVRRG